MFFRSEKSRSLGTVLIRRTELELKAGLQEAKKEICVQCWSSVFFFPLRACLSSSHFSIHDERLNVTCFVSLGGCYCSLTVGQNFRQLLREKLGSYKAGYNRFISLKKHFAEMSPFNYTLQATTQSTLGTSCYNLFRACFGHFHINVFSHTLHQRDQIMLMCSGRERNTYSTHADVGNVQYCT